MTKIEERELFLKYLANIYLKNPNLSFSYDIVYNELTRFCIVDNEEYIINRDGLVGVQVKLSNKYRNNDNVNISCDDYFWKIYNKGGKSENEYLNSMYDSIKLYVAVEAKDLYRISSLLFDYMIKENIIMHCKIANIMRSDVLVCRLKDVSDAQKVSNYISSLQYNSKIKPNAFSYNDGNVNMVMDGHLSYNLVLSRLICEYLKEKKNNNSMNNISNDDLYEFIENQISLLKGDDRGYYINLYEIDGNDKYRDFIMIGSIICRCLNNTLDIDTFKEYKEYKDVFMEELEYINFDSEEIKMKYVIYGLATYYGVDEVHNRIMKFIDTGDYTLFTRDGDKNIRSIMYNNFTPASTYEVISRIGWKALVNVSKITYYKNGEEQLFAAIKELFNNEGLLSFSNDDYARSRLGLVIPPELLRKVIVSKLEENNMNISSISLTQLILEEIGKLEEKKVNDRKQ